MEKKIALVTGAANGIGKAISINFLKLGYKVAGIDNNEELLKDTTAELTCSGYLVNEGEFFSLKTDVTDEIKVEESVKLINNNFGQINILVNNVGGSMAISQAIDLLSKEDWDKVIKLNLDSTFLCTKAVLPFMKQTKWGRIVNISSLAGRSRSIFGGTPYATAKAAIIGFTRQASKELGPYAITINAVAPGIILSGKRIKDYWDNKKTLQDKRNVLNQIPLERTGTSEDVAGTVSFLCSEEASYITGAVIDVNGGLWVG